MEYKEYIDHYISQVVELLNICFLNKTIIQKSFIWKHFDTFFKGKSIGVVAIDNGTICSFVCFTPLFITKGYTNIGDVYSCAVQATHPKYRRKGIVSHLTKIIEKNLGSKVHYVGFSNIEGVKIDTFSKRINYKIIGQMATQYVLSFPHKSLFQIKEIKEIPSSFVNHSNYLSIEKNDTYITWRYKKNPKNKYLYFSVYKNTAISGYLICLDTQFGYKVMDILLDTTNSKQYSEIVKSFSRYAMKQGKIFTSYSYLPNVFWKTVFPFISMKKAIEIYFTIKSKNNHLLKKDNWMVCAGDIQ